MADPVWPAGLPQNPYALDGAMYTPQSNRREFDTEAGPAKARRMFTSVYDRFTFSIEITRAQLAILNDFVINTLQDVRKFQWIDFRTGQPCQYRFVKRPSSQYVAGDGAWWLVSVELERMP